MHDLMRIASLPHCISAQVVPNATPTAMLVQHATLDQRPEMLLEGVATGTGQRNGLTGVTRLRAGELNKTGVATLAWRPVRSSSARPSCPVAALARQSKDRRTRKNAHLHPIGYGQRLGSEPENTVFLGGRSGGRPLLNANPVEPKRTRNLRWTGKGYHGPARTSVRYIVI